mgnify:CR=1 FL=1
MLHFRGYQIGAEEENHNNEDGQVNAQGNAKQGANAGSVILVDLYIVSVTGFQFLYECSLQTAIFQHIILIKATGLVTDSRVTVLSHAEVCTHIICTLIDAGYKSKIGIVIYN